MKLSNLIQINLRRYQPRGLIITPGLQHQFRIQRIYYHPGILDLGVILLAYYPTAKRVKKLSAKGDCLSVGHYLAKPEILKFGKDFENNHDFKKLPDKRKKHLVDELNDGTIPVTNNHQPTRIKNFPSLKKWLINHPNYKDIYLYQDSTWFMINKLNDQFQINHLKKAIKKALNNQTSSNKRINLVLGKVCPNCHYIVPVKTHFCYHCGLNFYHHARCAIIDAGHHHFPTQEVTKKCPRCKRRVSITNRYCNYCGHDFLSP